MNKANKVNNINQSSINKTKQQECFLAVRRQIVVYIPTSLYPFLIFKLGPNTSRRRGARVFLLTPILPSTVSTFDGMFLLTAGVDDDNNDNNNYRMTTTKI